MSDGSELERRISEAAEVLVDLKMSSANTAWQTITVAVLGILLEKGVVSRAEIAAKMDAIDAMASAQRPIAPAASEQIHAATLLIRHAFRLDAGRSGQ